MTPERAIELLGSADVARLATVDAETRPHLVPIVFAFERSAHVGVIYTAVDDKPKRTKRLARLANVRANAAVCVLADFYSDDWEQLWWVRADGHARVLEAAGDSEAADALRLLADRYAQYRRRPPTGPVIAIDVDRLTGWEASA